MKFIFRTVPFIIITLLFSGCEKDQDILSEVETDAKTLNIIGKFVKGDSIRQTDKNLDAFLRARFERSNSAAEDITSTTYGFTIDTNRVLQLVGDTYTNYIFSAYRPNQLTTDILENYMLTVFDSGDYMQVLVAYPMIENNGILEPSVIGTTLTYINDASLVTGAEMSPCANIADEIIGWDPDANCTYIRCTAGLEHAYGEPCNGSPSQQPQKICTGGWVTTGCMTSGGIGGQSPFNDPIGGGQNTGDPNNNPTEEVPIVPFVPYWLNLVNCVNDGAMGSFTNDLPLSSTDISWLQSQAGSVHANVISDFIAENGCTGNEDFIAEAVEAIQDGAEVDFEERILIDSTLVNKPCHAKMIKATFSGSSDLVQSVKDFFNDDTKYTYRLKASQFTGIYANANATTNSSSYCNQGDCTVLTEFNTTYLNTATDLAIAKTAIHESVHAILTYLFETGGLETEGDHPNYKELLIAYTNLRASLNPNNDGTQATLNNLQHEFMTDLVDEMADALSDYGQSRGYSLSLDYYKKLIWSSGSMMDTSNYTTEFSHFERLKVRAIGLAESTNTNQTYLINQYDEINLQPTGIQPSNTEPCNL